MVKNKGMQFFMENLKMKRKKGPNFFDLSERGFEPQIFSNFSAHDLIFHVMCGARDQIKKKSF
jgi:hypothetical protein